MNNLALFGLAAFILEIRLRLMFAVLRLAFLVRPFPLSKTVPFKEKSTPRFLVSPTHRPASVPKRSRA